MKMDSSPEERAPADGGKKSRKKSGVGFISSPKGIVAIVIIALLITGGTVTGVLLGSRSAEDDDLKEQLAELWYELSGELEGIDVSAVEDITPSTACVPIDGFITSVENSAEKIDDTADSVLALTPPEKWSEPYYGLIDIADESAEYLRKLNVFYWSFLKNLPEAKLDAQVTELEDLAVGIKSDVRRLLGQLGFSKESTFEPEILGLPVEYQEQIAQISGARAEHASERSREAVIRKARTSLNNFIKVLKRQGWQSTFPLMTEHSREFSTDPTEGGGKVTNVSIIGEEYLDYNKVEFIVEQTYRGPEGNEETRYYRYGVYECDGTWLVHDITTDVNP